MWRSWASWYSTQCHTDPLQWWDFAGWIWWAGRCKYYNHVSQVRDLERIGLEDLWERCLVKKYIDGSFRMGTKYEDNCVPCENPSIGIHCRGGSQKSGEHNGTFYRCQLDVFSCCWVLVHWAHEKSGYGDRMETMYGLQQHTWPSYHYCWEQHWAHSMVPFWWGGERNPSATCWQVDYAGSFPSWRE